MDSSFEMVDVGGKTPTRRRAVAAGRLKMSAEAFAMLKAGKLPKGDPRPLAEAAGLLAAKRTPESIPLCHPLPLEKVKVWFELAPELPGLKAFCEAIATAKTGVEMEALSGVSGALLTVWDVVKQVDPKLEFTVELLLKEGGKTDRKGAAPFRAAVITVSDRCSKGEAKDLSGADLAAGLKKMGGTVEGPVVVSDDAPRIQEAIRRAAQRCDVVVLTGGTGLAPRDVTPEAVAAVCDRLVPGIGEALRVSAHPMAALSRSVAGQLGRAIVVALPGSRGGVADGLQVLERLLPHAIEIARGADHDTVPRRP